MPLDPNIPHQDATYKIIGAAMRVHNRMKPGLKEEHVQRDLTGEMREDGLKVYEEYHIDIYDGDRWLGRLYLDHLVDDCVIVEVKSFGCVSFELKALRQPMVARDESESRLGGACERELARR